jgi:hypothetical protein
MRRRPPEMPRGPSESCPQARRSPKSLLPAIARSVRPRSSVFSRIRSLHRSLPDPYRSLKRGTPAFAFSEAHVSGVSRSACQRSNTSMVGLPSWSLRPVSCRLTRAKPEGRCSGGAPWLRSRLKGWRRHPSVCCPSCRRVVAGLAGRQRPDSALVQPKRVVPRIGADQQTRARPEVGGRITRR